MNFERLEKKLGYAFSNKGLLQKAFTHSSYANVHGGEDNERMEYLGDAVLALIVTEKQYLSGEFSEGEMTEERQSVVSKDALFECAEELELKEFLRYEGGERNVGKKTVSSLFETVVAAIYLDGGYAAAKLFVLPFVERLKVHKKTNYKQELQEFLQKHGLALPTYLAEKIGKDHAPEFFVTVITEGGKGTGQGSSKKDAEQAAAKDLLGKLLGK